MQPGSARVKRDQDISTIGMHIRHIPVAVFAMPLGMIGMTAAVQRLERMISMPPGFSRFFLIIAGLLFVIVLLLYGLKLLRFPAAVRAEFQNPTRMHLVATIPMSLLLFSSVVLPVSPTLSLLCWGCGVVVQIVVLVVILSVWMQQRVQVQDVNPSWFIPLVGNMLVPFAGVEHASIELNWLFLGFGIGFWMVLFVIVFSRILFFAPLEAAAVPTLWLLIAPPAIGIQGYVRLMEFTLDGFVLDAFARGLYGCAVLSTILVAVQYHRFRALPFSLAWWAASFPSAALTGATATMAIQTGLIAFQAAAIGMAVLLGILLLLLAFRTLEALTEGRLFGSDLS